MKVLLETTSAGVRPIAVEGTTEIDTTDAFRMDTLACAWNAGVIKFSGVLTVETRHKEAV